MQKECAGVTFSFLKDRLSALVQDNNRTKWQFGSNIRRLCASVRLDRVQDATNWEVSLGLDILTVCMANTTEDNAVLTFVECKRRLQERKQVGRTVSTREMQRAVEALSLLGKKSFYTQIEPAATNGFIVAQPQVFGDPSKCLAAFACAQRDSYVTVDSLRSATTGSENELSRALVRTRSTDRVSPTKDIAGEFGARRPGLDRHKSK